MKTLQNNFTTPEQSKRLLELGVPAWTADCRGHIYGNYKTINVLLGKRRNNRYVAHREAYPCWSVGRLIEIANICSNRTIPIEFWWRDTPMVDILYEFDNEMDFSRLEG